MLIVETIGRIRREHLIKGKSIKEIARGLKISRNTVRKVLRSGETSFSYEREIQPRPKLGRWKAELDRMLTANTSNPARERLTLIRLFEELRALGYEGGYDAVRRYARSWSREHASQMADADVPLTFAPGGGDLWPQNQLFKQTGVQRSARQARATRAASLRPDISGKPSPRQARQPL